ncbi:Hsp20/alpha crystallin family protein [Parafrankia sp. EUN1f]|uniref:Hsp20/alpha crystallin family protein n=1 Tax=Parafrankia sp. EUN1f TaxID=102897 RepID=UPI0001C43B12|nr:Hsp20/alpha crystallin family protein [Parafrankia sp. EUN1f]EFC82049.1 heat shock protein Hsp20 [Parafrankia sp. EUN1f]
MSTYLWDPFAAFERMDREFNEIVRRSWGSRDRAVRPLRAVPRPQGVVARPQNVVPSADVLVDGDDVLINLELPGVDVEKDVMVEIDRGALVVRGERSSEEEETVNGRVHRERWHGSFRREFALPENVDATAISARYDRGVLTVRLAGAAAAPRSTRIPVAAAAVVGALPTVRDDAGAGAEAAHGDERAAS